MSSHPVQPLERDANRRVRFKANPIVRYLLDAGPIDMNELARMPFDDEDRQQFAQLLGYSLCGYGELDYVSDEAYERAESLLPTPDVPTTELEAAETLLGKPHDVQRRNELERQFDLLRAAITDGRLAEWHFYERPMNEAYRTITFTFRDVP